MERTPKPRFVRASRVKISRRCESCDRPTFHIFYRFDDQAGKADESLIYDCQDCGETARVPVAEATDGLTGRPA